jgi:hypothetical protein
LCQCSPLADSEGTLSIHFVGPGATAGEGIDVLEDLLAGLQTV